MRPMIPPIEFLDQHLDVFQASTYDLAEDSFVIESGPPEKADLDLFCIKGIVDGLIENKVILSNPDLNLALIPTLTVVLSTIFYSGNCARCPRKCLAAHDSVVTRTSWWVLLFS